MSEKILLLFDVDGTLTEPRLPIQKNMIDALYRWKSCKNITLGIVGGSDIEKQIVFIIFFQKMVWCHLRMKS
jgi:phosphomannomutase